jgi:hypothetical protein
VAEHDDLDGEVNVAPADESDQLEDAAERSVEEREESPPDARCKEPADVKVQVEARV